ncbi:MAG: hypothetical protein VB861_01365 [Planctomycetaceae bacterium]
MDRRRWRRVRTSNLIPLLGIALLFTGCGDASKDEVAGGHDAAVSKPVEGADGTHVEHPADNPEPGAVEAPLDGDVPPLPPEPNMVAAPLPVPGTDGGPVVLSRSRYYRLDVETVDKSVLVTISRRWLFKDGFPKGLIASVRKHAEIKQTDQRLFDSRDGKVAASEYIRWEPKATGTKASALLLYVDGTDTDGEARHELAISVDLELDATLGKAQPKQTIAFDLMSVDLDLTTGQVTAVRWSDKPLADGDVEGDGPEHTVEIRVTGTLTAESSANIRGADALLADDVTNSFRSLASISFQNESHHGITLGWLGLDHLRHGLIVVPQQDGKLYDLQYSVAGASFELDSMRRQLLAESWPIVLRGRDYVGSTMSGQHVFQPIECMVSRRPPK